MRRSEHRYTRLGVALASAWFFASGAASAQHADAQRAATGQALFDKAVEEMKRGDLDSACPKLEEVTRLVPDGIGAKIELARCYERWGRTASAWAQWTRVEALARRKGQGDRQTEAAARAEALRPRVARLTVEVAPGTARIPKLAVRRGPVEVRQAQWGEAVPIDRGEHEIVAEAPGYAPFRKSVVVRADGDSLVVKVPALVKDASNAESGDPAAAHPHPPPPPSPASRPEDGGGWQEPVGIAAVAVGGAGIVVGGVLGALAIGKNDESNGPGLCSAETDRCTSDGLELRRSALDLATGSTIAFVAGGVVGAAGLVLWLTAPSRPERREASAGASIRLDGRGILLQSRF